MWTVRQRQIPRLPRILVITAEETSGPERGQDCRGVLAPSAGSDAAGASPISPEEPTTDDDMGHRVTRMVRREPRARADGGVEGRWDPWADSVAVDHPTFEAALGPVVR